MTSPGLASAFLLKPNGNTQVAAVNTILTIYSPGVMTRIAQKPTGPTQATRMRQERNPGQPRWASTMCNCIARQIMVGRAAKTATRHRTDRMAMVCMTWQATSGSGVMTGTIGITTAQAQRTIQKGQKAALLCLTATLIMFSEAATGTMESGDIPVLPTAILHTTEAQMILIMPGTTLVSALSEALLNHGGGKHGFILFQSLLGKTRNRDAMICGCHPGNLRIE